MFLTITARRVKNMISEAALDKANGINYHPNMQIFARKTTATTTRPVPGSFA